MMWGGERIGRRLVGNSPGQTREATSVYFVIRKNSAGKYWWRAVGNNNEIMAASQLMTSKESCRSSIDTIRSEAGSALVHDKTDEVKEREDV
jgi:uncharacterized protein YegP (UPF0339 family)